MKAVKLILSSFVVLSLLACNNGFLKDPRLYNSKDKGKQESVITPATEPDLGLTGGVDTFDLTDKWFNNKDEGFPHTEFEQMSLVGTYFDNNNVPQYAMASGNVWVSKDATKAEFVHAKAPNTEGQGYTIDNVHWYQYRGRNPLYAPDGNYNSQLQVTAKGNPKLSRFYFYRFTGDTLSPSLDNFLFAVDSYSKLMFAFAYPTNSKSVFGNNVPTAWGPTDGEPFLGTNYQFYMYDPVGYVSKDGGNYTVTMYDWFKNNLARGVYHPTLDGVNRDKVGTPYEDIAKKNPNGAGKSPFNNHTSDFFVENLKLLNGKAFIHRPREGEHVNGSWLHTITINTEGTQFTEIKEQYGTNDKDDVREFTYKSSTSATEGIFTIGEQEWKVTLKDQSTKITFSSEAEEFTVSTQSDPGPAWLIRVRGKIFSGSGYTYQFSDDGETIYLDNGRKTYTYAQQDANDRAVYKAGTLVFWGAKISENDTKITWTPTSWASASTTPSSLANSSPAWLLEELPENPKFSDYVKGRVYSYREGNPQGTDGKGDGLVLHSFTFGADGKTATKSTTEWRKVKIDDASHSLTDDQNDSMLAIANGKEFRLENDGKVLIVDNVRYYRDFNDPGPSFINRVKGKTFRKGSNTYGFSPDGRTLTMNGYDYTYEREYPHDNNPGAEYKWSDAQYYGLELSNDDKTIKMTVSGLRGAWIWLTLGWEATLVETK